MSILHSLIPFATSAATPVVYSVLTFGFPIVLVNFGVTSDPMGGRTSCRLSLSVVITISVSFLSVFTSVPLLVGSLSLLLVSRMLPIFVILSFYCSGLLAHSPNLEVRLVLLSRFPLPLDGCIPGLRVFQPLGFGITAFHLLDRLRSWALTLSARRKLVLGRQPLALASPESVIIKLDNL